MSSIDSIRVQKQLADLGYGSRRQLERWIESGRVSINGKRASLGDRVTANDVVRIDGRRVHKPKRTRAKPPRVLSYHKPTGEICSRNDPGGRPTVFGHLPALKTGRWINVGRLDINTSGLILFTNDGDLSHRLMHPSRAVEREYAVRVRGEVTAAVLRKLGAGVDLEDGRASFQSIYQEPGRGVNRWYRVVLTEGRTREVRRLWESQGLQVSRLMRVRYGPIKLPRGLRPGNWRELDGGDVESLQSAVGSKG